jgi:chromosome segregation ATPase
VFNIRYDPKTNFRAMQKNLASFFKAHGENLDQKSVDFLIHALEKNNLPGFDYIEFKQSLSTLARMVDLDEATRYKSAFASAVALGLDRQKLLASAEHYKKILSNEKVQFDAALQKQIEQRVSAKKVEVEKLRKQIEDYQSKIKELERKIQETHLTINQQDDLIQAAMEKIETTKNGFESTLVSIMQEIDHDIQNIIKHL